MTKRHLFMAALLSFAAGAGAAPFETRLLRIEVPEGFQGPVSDESHGGTVIAFAKPHPGRQTNTLLQLSFYEPRANGQRPPDEQLGPLADRCLARFLTGVERRRTNYTATPPTRITLDGLPAARAHWTGTAEGMQARGVMYCVIVGTTIVSMHVQDLTSSPPRFLRQAQAAVEAVRFKGRN